MFGNPANTTDAGLYPWYIQAPVYLFLIFIALWVIKKYVWPKYIFLFHPLNKMEGRVLGKSFDRGDDLKKMQYFIDFEMEDGETVDLRASRRQYERLQPKMKGMVKYKDARLLSFKPGFYHQ